MADEAPPAATVPPVEETKTDVSAPITNAGEDVAAEQGERV